MLGVILGILTVGLNKNHPNSMYSTVIGPNDRRIRVPRVGFAKRWRVEFA